MARRTNVTQSGPVATGPNNRPLSGGNMAMYAPPDRLVPKPGSKPFPGAIGQIPIIQRSGVDRVDQIEGILSNLMAGQFRDAAILSDAIFRDDRSRAVLDTRLGGATGADVEVLPGTDAPLAQEIADLFDPNVGGAYDMIFPPSITNDLLEYGIMNNFAVAQIEWYSVDTVIGKVWMPQLVPFHTQFVFWDWGSCRYTLTTADGAFALPDLMRNPYGDGRWFVWCPKGYQFAWRHAMVKSLADLYLLRRWSLRDLARFNEKNGTPTDLVYVPEDADDGDGGVADDFFRDVANRGAASAIKVPRRDGDAKDSGYGVDLLESKSLNYKTFPETIEMLNNAIAVLVLGQNLTTEMPSGTGSKAAEQGHDKVRVEKKKEDAAIAGAYRRQVLSWWAAYNFNNKDLAPLIRFMVEPPDDLSKIGAGLKAMGDGMTALKGAFEQADIETLADEQGIPKLTDAELAAERREKDERAAALAPPQGPPMGGGGAPPAPGGPPAKGGKGKPPNAGKPGKKQIPPAAARASLKNDGSQVVARREFAGFKVAIENPAGTVRRWVDDDAKETGSVTMSYDYGFFEDHLGADEEELDVYLGPNERSQNVYVIHQLAKPDYAKDDEDKVMLGFDSEAEARAAYTSHRDDGARAIGAVTCWSMERFRARLKARRSGKKIHARAALSRRHAGHRPAPKRPKKIYADHVADRARRTAARAMESSMHKVVDAVRASSGPDDLKRRLVLLFPGLHSPQLAKVVEKARIMAKAGGMDSAWQQV